MFTSRETISGADVLRRFDLGQKRRYLAGMRTNEPNDPDDLSNSVVLTFRSKKSLDRFIGQDEVRLGGKDGMSADVRSMKNLILFNYSAGLKRLM